MSELLTDDIGVIGKPEKNIRFVGFPGSPFTMLSGEQSDADYHMAVVLDKDEIATLGALVTTAQKVAAELPPQSVQVIGELPPRPMTLRVLAAHGAFRVIALEIKQCSTGLVVQLGLEEAPGLAHIMQMCQSGADRVAEPCKPQKAHVKSVRGQRVEMTLADGQSMVFSTSSLTHCFGIYGESLTVEELPAGSPVVFWTLLDQADLVLKVKMDPPPSKAAAPGFAAEGQALDGWLQQGRLYEALLGYENLLERLIKGGGKVDIFLLAKITLGRLLCEARLGNLATAMEIWLSRHANPLYKAGIVGLERGQVSIHDNMVYRLLSAYLNSMSDDVTTAGNYVTKSMEAPLRYGAETDRSMWRLALANWRLHLTEIYGENVDSHLAAWQAQCKTYGRPVVPKAIWYPQPASWVVDWTTEEPTTLISGAGTASVSQAEPKKKGLFARFFGR